MTRSILSACVMLAFFIPYSRAQSISPKTLNATGGSKVINGNTYEWSVGEMALVSTSAGSNIVVTQGLLQPVPGPSGIDVVSNLSKQLEVYPNPAGEMVYLRYDLKQAGKLEYILQDMTGKAILKNNINAGNTASTTEISLGNLPSATYMLYISFQPVNGTAEQASFKIDKLKN